MGTKDLCSVQQLVVATQQLHATKLYQRLSDSDYFLIRTPLLDEPAVAVLMGRGGEAYGLNVFLGASTGASYNALFNASSEAQAHRSMRQSHMIGYQMFDAIGLSLDSRRWLKKVQVRLDPAQLYPDPMSLEPGKLPVMTLQEDQTRLLLHLVRGILAASQGRGFDPCGLDPRGRVLCVELDKDTQNPSAAVVWERQDSASPTKAPAEDDPIGARFDLAGLDPSGDSWMVGLMPVPGSIQGDDRQPHMLVVCSKQNAGLWPSLLMDIEPTDLVDALARLMRGECGNPNGESNTTLANMTPPPTGRPTRLILDGSLLHDAASLAFEPLDIECINGENSPGLQTMLKNLQVAFGDNFFDEQDHDEDDEADEAAAREIPEANDLEGWKRIDGWLKDHIHDGYNHDRRYHGTRALKRYFGKNADCPDLLHTFQDHMIVDSYAHWFAMSYRSTRNRPTLAQQWLEDPWAYDSMKVLLRAVTAQGPSIYRVNETDEDSGKITFADLFTGELTIVTDFALSTCVDPGLIIPAKLVPVGDFHFYFPAGPPLTGPHFNAAMEFFEDQRLTPSPELFQDHPYLLGWLWDVVDQSTQRALDLRNSDGHLLIPHIAVFVCSSRSALEGFLAEQPDYQPQSSDSGTWVWFRRGTAMLGEASGDHDAGPRGDSHQEMPTGPVTLLGEVQIQHGQATLTVNSRERLDTARETLERVHGVKLLSFQVQPPGTALENAPGAEPAPPLGRESATTDQDHQDDLTATRAYITQHYQQWFDCPLPALANKTPREAAQIPKLRQKLAAMVRAIPDPANLNDPSIQINAPREMILKELGLDEA